MDKVRVGCIALVVVPIIGAWLLRTPEDEQREAALEAVFTARYEAEDQVKAILRDPDSAEFRHVKPGVCGYVNSKNGFGGMAGFQRFIITSAGPVLETQRGLNRSAYDKAWRESCATPAI